MGVLLLSRIQYAINICCHFFYPPLSIGLSFMIVLIGAIYLFTKKDIYKKIVDFLIKIFALTFALGVATGLVMAFAFGTNWSRYTNFAGDVIGSVLASEALFAFLLESGFLGLLLFGRGRFSDTIHFIASLCVSIGAHFSGILILIVNSWMQTPQDGFKIVSHNGVLRTEVTDVWKIIFNPSTVDRCVHTILSCWLAGIFLVISIAAYYILKKRFLELSYKMMNISMVTAGVVLIAMLGSGDSNAKMVAKHQPAKFAAMEGVFKTRRNCPVTAFGWVDEKKEKTYGLKIPSGSSLLLYHDKNAIVKGLDKIKKEHRPPVHIVFQTYHFMVMSWGAMFLLVILWAFFRKNMKKWLLVMLICSFIIPSLAIQAGWLTAEIGRQPWIVYNIFKTKDGVCPFLVTSQVKGSIAMFSFIYPTLFVLFFYLLKRKILQGPEEDEVSTYRNPYH